VTFVSAARKRAAKASGQSAVKVLVLEGTRPFSARSHTSRIAATVTSVEFSTGSTPCITCPIDPDNRLHFKFHFLIDECHAYAPLNFGPAICLRLLAEQPLREYAGVCRRTIGASLKRVRQRAGDRPLRCLRVSNSKNDSYGHFR